MAQLYRIGFVLIAASNQTPTSGIRWGIVFYFGVWSLWLQRNRVVFKNHIICTSLMTETLAKASEFAYLGLNDRVRRSIIPIQVRWFPPPDNWFKLNSDGSSMGNPGRAGGGGIIQNFQGDWPDWVSGYARAIGYTTSVTAELWALRDGINLCIELSLTNVLIELDAKIVVDMLKKNEGSSNSNDIILADCKEGLQKIPKVQIQHCYREANKCANALARRPAMLSQDFVIFQSPVEVALLVTGLKFEWLTCQELEGSLNG